MHDKLIEPRPNSRTPPSSPTPRKSIIGRAVLDGIPLYIPAIPLALVIGLTITNGGINPVVGWSSSPIIFGGAAQLTLMTLIGSGSALIAAVAAALVVNARHLMYSAAISPRFRGQPRWFRFFGPYLLIDQLFALDMLLPNPDPRTFRIYHIAAGLTFWTSWQLTVAVGLIIGPVIPEAWNLDFAIPLLFLALVVLGIDHFSKAVAALSGALVAYLAISLPHRTGLLVGSLVGILAGTLTYRLGRKGWG